MKVFISADIEGITGTTHWDETEKKHPDYTEFREQMTAEVTAACEGALQAGAQEIFVKDAHDSARNLIAARLPSAVTLMRGWSGHPYMMADGLDASFQAMMMVGYHSRSGLSTSPLAHTMTGANASIRINDRYVSEFLVNAYIAGLVGVPVVFVSGDAGICKEAADLIPGLKAVAVKKGIGSATVNIHPQTAIERIRAGVSEALSGDLSTCKVTLPEHFSVDIRYKDHARAYTASFFPGASLADPFTVHFENDEYFEVLRLFGFVL